MLATDRYDNSIEANTIPVAIHPHLHDTTAVDKRPSSHQHQIADL
jgi:hypothetical protein